MSIGGYEMPEFAVENPRPSFVEFRPAPDSIRGCYLPAKGQAMLRPLSDRIVVEPLEAESASPGGILIPDQAKEKQTRGRVQAVGPGKPNEDGTRTPPAVKPGDVVLYGKYAGNLVEVAGKEVVVLREDDLLAIVDS